MTSILCFSRSRRTQVERVDDTTLKANCTMQDTLTDAFLEIQATLPDMEVTRVRSEVKRSPRPICLDQSNYLQKIIGMRIGAGMTEILKGTLEQGNVCAELVFMFEECCHGVILSLTRDVLAKAPSDEAGEHEFYSNMVRKNIRLYNRCAAFDAGSSLVAGLTPPE